MLVIHPDECIDCGVCEPECPIDAIIPDTDKRASAWLEMNRAYAGAWPVITKMKPPLEKADLFKDVKDKFTKFFSDKPGKGD